MGTLLGGSSSFSGVFCCVEGGCLKTQVVMLFLSQMQEVQHLQKADSLQ